MGCKGWRVSNIPKVVKMCSITNTAHPTRRQACLGVGVGVCVVSSDALRSSVLTDVRQKGACNQGKEGFRFLLWWRHS